MAKQLVELRNNPPNGCDGSTTENEVEPTTEQTPITEYEAQFYVNDDVTHPNPDSVDYFSPEGIECGKQFGSWMLIMGTGAAGSAYKGCCFLRNTVPVVVNSCSRLVSPATVAAGTLAVCEVADDSTCSAGEPEVVYPEEQTEEEYTPEFDDSPDYYDPTAY